MKTDTELLRDLEQAIARVVGPRPFTMDTFLKKDLQINYIDLVDLSFELEEITGIEFRFNQLLLAGDIGASPNDLQVRQIIDHLSKKQK
ncbi:MAG: hypothetical protein ACXVB9_00715 [Bdellovibrionota bacterium]